jgi:hypothetical protein
MLLGVRYGGSTRIHGLPLDLRCEGHFVVCPWSVSSAGIPYRWLGPIVPVKDLPTLDPTWLRQDQPKQLAVTPDPALDENQRLRRARAYVARIEGAVSGNRGHDCTIRVAGVLIQKFGLTIDQAWPIFLEWNQTCEPPWSEKELLHKLQDALRLRPLFRKEDV